MLMVVSLRIGGWNLGRSLRPARTEARALGRAGCSRSRVAMQIVDGSFVEAPHSGYALSAKFKAATS
jgi:hypothetical protein